MRRRAITILVLATIVAAFFGTWRVAYRMGESDGRTKVGAARAAFLARSGGAPQPAGSGQPGAGGGRQAGGGSAVTGSAASGTTPSGTRASGSARAGGTGSSLTGHVTKIDGNSINLQQTDNTTVIVTTDGTTTIEKLVPGALSDLKTGDLITVDGTKTGDTAFDAKTITSLGQRAGGGGQQAAGGNSLRGRPGAAGGTGGQASPPGGGAAVTGRITSIASGTITVQGFDGTSVTVTSSPATVVMTRQPGTLADIKTGDLLVVQGAQTGATGFLARSIINQGASG
jgi:hypothetical protein